MNKITLEMIEEARRLMEVEKPRCPKCGTGLWDYFGPVGYGCRCGCEKQCQTIEGIKAIQTRDAIIEGRII